MTLLLLFPEGLLLEYGVFRCNAEDLKCIEQLYTIGDLDVLLDFIDKKAVSVAGNFPGFFDQVIDLGKIPSAYEQ